MSILGLGGATIATCANLEKENFKIDIVLTDSLCATHEVPLIAPTIANVLNNVSLAENGEVLELAWAIQCIVRRKRIPISDKFKIRTDNPQAGEKHVSMLSMKSAQFGKLTRYEVGDSIIFGRKMPRLSYGRIAAIKFDAARIRTLIDVRILELHNENELTDGGQNASKITIEENELRGQLFILGEKDYKQVHWSDNEFVFAQKKVYQV